MRAGVHLPPDREELDRYAPRVRWVVAGLLVLGLAGCASPGVVETMAPAPSPTAATSSMELLPSPIIHEPAASLDAALREELLAMLAEDQSVRTGVPLPGDDRTAEELLDDMGNVDGRNSRMAEILRSEEHTSELQSRRDLVCRLL